MSRVCPSLLTPKSWSERGLRTCFTFGSAWSRDGTLCSIRLTRRLPSGPVASVGFPPIITGWCLSRTFFLAMLGAGAVLSGTRDKSDHGDDRVRSGVRADVGSSCKARAQVGPGVRCDIAGCEPVSCFVASGAPARIFDGSCVVWRNPRPGRLEHCRMYAWHRSV